LGVGAVPAVDGPDGPTEFTLIIGAVQAVFALAAGDAVIADDAIAGFEVFDFGTDGFDHTRPLVARGHGKFDGSIFDEGEFAGVDGVVGSTHADPGDLA